jgi:hypothetical protein
MKQVTLNRELDRRRVTIMSLIVVSFFVLLSIMASSLPTNIWGLIAAFTAGLVVTPVIASPIEWAVHRYVYHRSLGFLKRIYSIHLAHHHLYFPTWRYVTSGPARRIPILDSGVSVPQATRWGNAATYMAHFAFYMVLGGTLIWLPGWILSRNVPFLVGSIVGTIVISDLFITVHDAIHRPGSHPLMERHRWFQFLDEHHYIHHLDTEANVNFLLPLADWLFCTLRIELTSDELVIHGPREAAKSRLVGNGEPADRTTIRSVNFHGNKKGADDNFGEAVNVRVV